MRFKIFSTEIYISFIFMVCITLMLSTDRTGLFIPVFISVILHEVSHLFSMWILNCEPKQIRLIPGSIQIVRKFVFKKNGEIFIALSGPLMNLLLFCIFIIHYCAFESEISLNFAAINLIFGLFNLLPIRGLDGGVILYNSVLRFFDCVKAEKTLNGFTLFFALTAIVTATILFITGTYNFSLLILGIYFLLAFLFKM